MLSVAWKPNGPPQGQVSGLVIFDTDLVAVAATAACLMKVEPRKTDYRSHAGEFLGNIAYERIEQLGEKLEAFEQNFQVIESFQYLKSLVG